MVTPYATTDAARVFGGPACLGPAAGRSHAVSFGANAYARPQAPGGAPLGRGARPVADPAGPGARAWDRRQNGPPVAPLAVRVVRGCGPDRQLRRPRHAVAHPSAGARPQPRAHPPAAGAAAGLLGGGSRPVRVRLLRRARRRAAPADREPRADIHLRHLLGGLPVREPVPATSSARSTPGSARGSRSAGPLAGCSGPAGCAGP